MSIHYKNSPAQCTDEAKKQFDVWNEGYPEFMNTYGPNEKAAYVMRGAKLLAKLSEVHFMRKEEKPRWWEFVFRTKRAVEYSNERKAMKEIATQLKKLDPESNYCGYLKGYGFHEQKAIYDNYLNEKTHSNELNSADISEHIDSVMKISGDVYTFHDMDAKMQEISDSFDKFGEYVPKAVETKTVISIAPDGTQTTKEVEVKETNREVFLTKEELEEADDVTEIDEDEEEIEQSVSNEKTEEDVNKDNKDQVL